MYHTMEATNRFSSVFFVALIVLGQVRPGTVLGTPSPYGLHILPSHQAD